MMNLRAWISTITSASALGGFAFAQTPPSGSPAALAAQTSTIHPANEKPTFTMRTAGQPDRAIRVLKMTDSADSDSVAEVQDVQSGRNFTMPGRVVKAMLAGTKPTMPSAAPIPLQTPTIIPMAAPTPKPMPAAMGAPVFQPNRITSAISERPHVIQVMTSRELPTVTSVQAIVPNTVTPPAALPTIEPVPEEIKPTLLRPMTTPISEALPPPPAELPTLPVPVPVEEPTKVTPPVVVPIAKIIMPLEPAVAPVPIPAIVPVPVPVPVPALVAPKPVAPTEPSFGTRLIPHATNTSVKSTPVQIWQPILNPGSPAPTNNSIWQPIPESPKTTTVATSCCFDANTCCTDTVVKQHVIPHVMVERVGATTNSLAQLEDKVRESSQNTIYDLCTATKPSAREQAATKLCESRFAQSLEVKTAILKVAIADPAPSVRAHCIECLMKLGHNETGYMLHLKAVASDGPKIVQTAAQAALAQMQP